MEVRVINDYGENPSVSTGKLANNDKKYKNQCIDIDFIKEIVSNF